MMRTVRIRGALIRVARGASGCSAARSRADWQRAVAPRRLPAAVGGAGRQRVRLADHAHRAADHRGDDARSAGGVVGLLVAMQLAPGVVLALFAGGFVDRGRKRRILIAADLIRAVAVASLTLAWALGVLSMAARDRRRRGRRRGERAVPDHRQRVPAGADRTAPARRGQREARVDGGDRRDHRAGERGRADRGARGAARGRDRRGELPVVGVHARPDPHAPRRRRRPSPRRRVGARCGRGSADRAARGVRSSDRAADRALAHGVVDLGRLLHGALHAVLPARARAVDGDVRRHHRDGRRRLARGRAAVAQARRARSASDARWW